MNYPVDDFVADFRAAIASAKLVSRSDIAQSQFRVFEQKYDKETLNERLLLFRQTMLAIHKMRFGLSEFGYVTLDADFQVKSLHENLLLALHRIMIEQQNTRPSLDEIKEAIDFFVSRN